MADLPLIQPGRVQIDGVPQAALVTVTPPQIDRIGLRVAGQSMGNIGQVLDRLSTQLFQRAGDLAEEVGQRYVADNPVTLEQLEAAKTGDTTPLMNRAGGGTIFQKVVAKARAIELSSHFEAEGRSELVKLLAAVETGQATSTDVQNSIATMTEGYTAALRGVDPEATLKFRATMATHGNTVLKAAYETEAKRAQAERLSKFEIDFGNSLELMRATVEQGYWLDPQSNKPRSIDELVDVFVQNIETSSVFNADPKQRPVFVKAFKEAVAEAKIDAVVKVVTSDEYLNAGPDGLERIRRGDVGKMSIVFQGMLEKDKAKVRAEFQTANNQRESLQKQKLDDEKRVNEQRSIDLLERIYRLPETSQARRDLITELTAIPNNGVPIGTLKDLLAPNQGESNARVQFNLLQGIYDGTINSPEQIWSFVGKGLTGKDAVSALKLMTGEGRRDEAELARGLNKLAGINVTGGVVVLDPKGAEFQRLNRLRARATEIQAAAQRDGKVMMPSQIIDQLTRETEQARNSEQAKQARTQLEVYQKKDWINGPITRDSLATLERKAGSDANKQKELKRIRQLLDLAEGNI